MENLNERFRHHLKSSGLRYTQERQELMDVVLAMPGHFTAEDILSRMKSASVKGSRATLYRLLPVLVKANLIQQSLLSDEHTKYEVSFNREHHDHLICSFCSKVVEFQDNAMEILQREIASKYGFILENHVMELVGRCSACQKKSLS